MDSDQTGRKTMNRGEEILKEFLDNIERYTSSIHLAKIDSEKLANIDLILNYKFEDFESMNSLECSAAAYQLYSYAEYIESEKAKQKNILDWAESSIWYIISGTLDQYGDKFTKWQAKFYPAVRENPLASQILKVKNYAEAKVKILNGKHERITKMADILNNLSRRKNEY
jgi:hypothetical protein